MRIKWLTKVFPLAGSYIQLACITILWIVLVRFVFPWDAIPYVFEQFLYFENLFRVVFEGIWPHIVTYGGGWGALFMPVLAAWPLFLAGFVLNFWKMSTSTNPPEVHQQAGTIPIWGLTTSISAGILEELTFRWVVLYGAMGLLWVLDRILGGFLQNLIPAGLFNLLNFVFVGNATAVLEHPGAWTLGLAALLSNWKFQEGHLYQGVTGLIFSGIGGIFFFRTLFAYGLFAAMGVHFLFDLMVFLMLAVDVFIEIAAGANQPQRKLYQWYVWRPR